MKFRSVNTIYRNAEAIGHFPDFTPEEGTRFLRAIQFKERSYIENTFSNLVMLPISGKRMTADRLGAFLALQKGDYREAARFFGKVRMASGDGEEQIYLLCLMEYARYRSLGLDLDETFKVLRRLFRADVADRVRDQVKDPEEMLRKVFPKLNCPNCEGCPLAGTECLQPQEEEAFRKIRAAMAHSRVSQTELLETLTKLADD